MKTIMILMIIGLALSPSISFSETSDSLNTKAYIEDMGNYLALKLSLNNDFQEFWLITKQTDLHIKPNVSNFLKLSVSYRFISFSVSIAPKFLPGNNDNDLKGNTTTYSLDLALEFKHLIQTVSYEKATGFYLANTRDFVPGWVSGKDKYIQFPYLVYKGFQGYTAYKFNDELSFKALSSQTERQTKSAGSLYALLSYRYYIIDNQVELTGQNSSQKSNNFESMISGGYFYTKIIRKSFYVSAGLLTGAGLVYTNILTRMPEDNYRDHYLNPIWRLGLDGALGFNSERFFAGGQLKASLAGYDQNNTSTIILNDRITYQIFMGYRFTAPAFMRKTTDKAADLEERSVRKLRQRTKSE